MIRSEGRWFFIFLVGQSNVNKISYKSFSLSNSDLIWIFISFELRLLLSSFINLLKAQQLQSVTWPVCQNFQKYYSRKIILWYQSGGSTQLNTDCKTRIRTTSTGPQLDENKIYHILGVYHSKRSDYDPVNNSLSVVSPRLWALLVRLFTISQK